MIEQVVQFIEEVKEMIQIIEIIRKGRNSTVTSTTITELGEGAIEEILVISDTRKLRDVDLMVGVINSGANIITQNSTCLTDEISLGVHKDKEILF